MTNPLTPSATNTHSGAPSWSPDEIMSGFKRSVEWIAGKLAEAWAWLVACIWGPDASLGALIAFPEGGDPLAFAQQLWGEHQQGQVTFTIRESSLDGNCFLTSCIHASGAEVSFDGHEVTALRQQLLAIAQGALRGNAQEDQFLRRSFITAFLSNEAGLGTVMPRFEPWEEHCLDHFPPNLERDKLILQLNRLQFVINLQRKLRHHPPHGPAHVSREHALDPDEEWFVRGSEQEDRARRTRTILALTPERLASHFQRHPHDDQRINSQQRTQRSQSFLLKRERHAQFFLNAEEQQRFIMAGYDALMQTDAADGALQARLTNIYRTYTEAAGRNGTYNGQFEQLLAARHFRRPLITFWFSPDHDPKNPLRTNERWAVQPRGEHIIGAEYQNVAPLFIAFRPGHYRSVSFFRQPQPPQAGAPRA